MENTKQPMPIDIRSSLRKVVVFDEFVIWCATPETMRIKMGIEEQKDFARIYSVSERTLTRWKNQPGFWQEVGRLHLDSAKMRTGTVIMAIYKSALKGNPISQITWMKIFEGYTEKSETTNTNKVEVGVNDIRFIIDGLPEPYKTKFHGYINEIVVTANAVRNASDPDDPVWSERPADDIQGQADNDAPDIPDEKQPDAVAESDQGRIRNDVVREIYPRHNESAERGWKEQTAGNAGV